MNIVTLNARQMKQLAESVAELLAEKLINEKDEMISIDRLSSETDLSKTWIYHHTDELGAVKVGNRLFFSRRKVDRLIREGRFS